jgi:dipeptide/tripeptide permease
VADPQSQPSPPVKTNHPVGFWFIFFGELAERCSFYGMKALLTYYLIDVFGKVKGDAYEIVHLYVAGCYATGLIGGFVADRFLGKYWTIVCFAVPYIIGQFLVGMGDITLMYAALVILAFGSGIIKPNISTLMGMTYDQQRPGQDMLRTRAFGYFYMAINIGSFLSQIICPTLRDIYGKYDAVAEKFPDLEHAKRGYLAGFIFPAFLMILALVLFAAGKRFYAKEDIKANQALDAAGPESKWAIAGRLFGLFFIVLFFWVIFDQHATTWISFAKEYLRLGITLPFEVNGSRDFRISPETVQSANPFFIVIFVPLLNWLYSYLIRNGYRCRPTDKMFVGFLLTGLACFIHVIAGTIATNEDGSITKVSIFWQIWAYLILTIAEVLISVTGLELAFTAAPKSMKSFVTACWLVPVFLANLLASQLAKLYPSEEKHSLQFETAQGFFLGLTVMLLVVSAVFVVVARRFNRHQSADSSPQ